MTKQDLIDKQTHLKEQIRYLSKTIARLQEVNKDLEYDIQLTDSKEFKGGLIDEIYSNDMFIEEKWQQLLLLQEQLKVVEDKLDQEHI